MNDKTDLSPWKNTVLLHNGAAHNLQAVMQQAAAGNVEVTIDLSEIGPLVAEGEIAPNLFPIQPKNNEINQLPLVLYKYNGRYHALVGSAHIERAKTNKQTQISGKLLSTPALKKARIIKPEDQMAPPSPSKPNGVHRPHGGRRV